MRVLVLTKVFPNSLEPLSSPFNRQQVAALRRHCEVEVIAPVPWFPGARLFGNRIRASRLTRVATCEQVDGLTVRHPRGLYLPRIGIPVAVPLLCASLAPWVRRCVGRFDAVLGTWLYPDACAAVWLAGQMGVPCIVKAHGSDVNTLAQRRDVRFIVRWFLERVSAAVAPSRALVRALVALGAPPASSFLLPNGVNRSIFHPMDRDLARQKLGLDGQHLPTIVYVGRLDPAKGLRELHLAYQRLAEAFRVRLVLVGDGPMRDEVRAWAREHPGRVIAAGPMPLDAVACYLGAADVTVLPSHAEGTPNSVLEALACGRPVVATEVGGIPDVIAEGQNGLLVPPRDPETLADRLALALHRGWDASAIARSGPIDWDESGARLFQILCQARRRSQVAA